jgi:predicted PurR-regulated permease PerM
LAIIHEKGLTGMGRLISVIVLLASIVIIGALFYKVMVGFLVPAFLAAVLVVVFRPLHRWVLEKTGQRDYLAAGITTALIVFIVLLPTALIISMAAVQGTGLVGKINNTSVSIGLNNARKKFGLQSPCQEHIRSIQFCIEEIQTEVGASTMAELADPAGKLARLTRKIDQELEDLLPSLRKFLDKEVETNLRTWTSETAEPSGQAIAEQRKQLQAAADQEYVASQESWQEAIDRFHGSLDHVLQAAGLPRNETLEGREGLVPVRPRGDLVELQSQVVQLGADWQPTKEKLLGGNRLLASLRELANPSPRQLRDMTASTIDYLRPKLISLTGATAEFLVRLMVGTAIMLVALYFFLYDGPRMVQSLMKLSPLDDRYEMELLTEFDRISRAIVLAMILSAIVQGLVAGLGYYMVGMQSLIFLILISVFCGLIPFVGPSVVWVPVCIYLAVFEERYLAASLLAVWGLLAVASVDNVVKAYVLHGQSQLHPLLALLSVLGGVQALGPIGLVVGPISVVMLQTLLSILRREISHIDQSGVPGGAGNSTGKSLSTWMSKLKRSEAVPQPQPINSPAEEASTAKSVLPPTVG